MTYIVGLTGGIGAGKSTVAQFFSTLGAPIIDTDVIAKELVRPGTPFFTKILEHFGKAKLLMNNGEINRAALRDIVFTHCEKRKWLEDLLHPTIAEKVKKKLSEIDYPYCIVVVPLLVENIDVYKPILNHILVLDVSEAQQLIWSVARDNCSKEAIQKIMLSQATRSQRLQWADTVLRNEGTLEELNNKIKDLHHIFLSKGHRP